MAVLVFDPDRDSLHWRFREDWDIIADPEDVEVLGHFAEDFAQKVQEIGPGPFLAYLEDTLSNWLQLTERSAVDVENVAETVDTLFETMVNGR